MVLDFNLSFKMELPLELIGIIREFSKPVFTHWKIFNDAKEAVEPRHWKPLREALLGPNAGQMCQVLAIYLAHLRDLQCCHEKLRSYEHNVGWRPHIHSTALTSDQKKNLSDALGNKIRAQQKEASHYRKVLYAVYGKLTPLVFDYYSYGSNEEND